MESFDERTPPPLGTLRDVARRNDCTVEQARVLMGLPPRPTPTINPPTPRVNDGSVTVNLEWIGWNQDRDMGEFALNIRRPWVAQITGVTGRGFARDFLRPMQDYRRTNQVGSRGVTRTYHLLPGHIYEVSRFTSWRSRDRFFCRISDGEIVRLEANEVRSCLS